MSFIHIYNVFRSKTTNFWHSFKWPLPGRNYKTDIAKTTSVCEKEMPLFPRMAAARKSAVVGNVKSTKKRVPGDSK